MRRREFVISLGALVLETAAVYAAAPTTLGGRLRQLTAPWTGDNRATYLPDGTALLFASRRTGRSQIWTMDPDGSDPRQLYESAANDYGRVAPSRMVDASLSVRTAAARTSFMSWTRAAQRSRRFPTRWPGVLARAGHRATG
jgi:WD40-like Beta Propeller Repeat